MTLKDKEALLKAVLDSPSALLLNYIDKPDLGYVNMTFSLEDICYNIDTSSPQDKERKDFYIILNKTTGDEWYCNDVNELFDKVYRILHKASRE